ncbi:MAG: M56 family metallopeptidase, partial [Prevotellaceae bacterium]|nr:M56 family metallopeptidase [Prevotellaceae bacterium]
MTELLTYLLKTAIVQCVLLFCYRLLLRRDTFHKMIRYYFMAGLIFSYIAPLIHFDFRILPPVQNNILQLSRVAQPAIVLEITEEPKMLFIPEILEISGMLPNVEPLPKTTTKWWQQYSFVDILTTVFIAGVIVMLIRFVIQFLSLASLRVCRKYKYQQYNILDIEAPIKPFSFGKRIYINPKLHDVGEFDEIIRHELVHVRQRHSVDIIVAAVNRSVFWWNPFAWVLNSDIRNNLEYIVDNEMLQSGINRKHYQYHLLHINQLTYINDMANYFNFSNFKKRIEMMDKEKTHPVYKMKWLLLPLVATVILLSFNAKRAIATNFAFAGKSENVEHKPPIFADTT